MASSNGTTSSHENAATSVPLKLEVVVIPVSDYDRARQFYIDLGWRVDSDSDDGRGYSLMQVTPPGSPASVIFGTAATGAQPGTADGLFLVVDDIDEARESIAARGVDVTEPFHAADGSVVGGFHVGDEGRAPGHDPQRRSYATYASFFDSEGNRWLLQEITERFPGRV